MVNPYFSLDRGILETLLVRFRQGKSDIMNRADFVFLGAALFKSGVNFFIADL